MTLYSPTSLVYAATDRKHRPASHPVVRTLPAPPISPFVGDAASYYQIVGERLRAAREQRGWTQRALGRNLGMSGVSICKYESGLMRPSAWTLYRLERIFGRLRP